MLSSESKELIRQGRLDGELCRLYACGAERAPQYRRRILRAVENFERRFGPGRDISIFSAPGRTEIGGNHTDHQRGRVLAASVNLDVIAVAGKNEGKRITVQSEGYEPDTIDAANLAVHPEETNSSAALIRGIAAEFTRLGYSVGGFDAYTTSDVLTGSGLSSSAAFEVLTGTVINHLFCGGKESALRIAQIGKYAENVYFGKPCGLMDQAASSIGGLISIDFVDAQHPQVRRVDYDFARSGHTLCIIDTRSNHADLTPDYAAIPAEMGAVAAFFGKEVLSEVDETEFFRSIAAVRAKTGDRAVLRAIHFFGDNERVLREVSALEEDRFDEFCRLITESGASSFMYLQNVFSPSHVREQGVSLTLALCQKFLGGTGAYRVHGGGFAGTVQAFVPNERLSAFTAQMESVLGAGSCHSLSIRPAGGTRIL